MSYHLATHLEGFPGGSLVKNLPAMQEMQVHSLGGEYPLEEEMATHSSILAWRIPWTEEPGGFQSMESQKWQTRLSDLNNDNNSLGRAWHLASAP